MNYTDSIAPDFLKSIMEPESLVGRLAAGARGHRSKVKAFKELQEAAARGQKPDYAIYYNGPVSGPAFLGLAPSQVFGASDLLLSKRLDGAACSSILAAAEFAKRLGVRHHVMIANSAVAGPAKAKAGRDALAESAAVLERKLGITVAPLYYDANANTLTGFKRRNGKFAAAGSAKTALPIYEAKKGYPRAVGCSCCDSRALHGHMYCAQPGEFLETNTIAAIVPPRKKTRKGASPLSVWAQIDYAHDTLHIREFSVTGHSNCGGIEALVKWCRTGKPPGGYVGIWLEQAYAVVKEVVDYAKRNKFFDSAEKIARLAEMQVTQWSSCNIKAYSPKSLVLPLYLDITTRRIYPLPAINPREPMRRSLDRTARAVMALYEEKLPNLSEVEASLESTTRFKQRKIAERLMGRK